MGRKTKIQLEAEKLTRTRNFKQIKAMLWSKDPSSFALAIGIMRAKKFNLVAKALEGILGTGEYIDESYFDFEKAYWEKYLRDDIKYEIRNGGLNGYDNSSSSYLWIFY